MNGNVSISVNIYWQLAAEQMLWDESLGNPNVTCLQKVDCLLEIQLAFVDEKLQKTKSPRAGITRSVFAAKAWSPKADILQCLSVLVTRGRQHFLPCRCLREMKGKGSSLESVQQGESRGNSIWWGGPPTSACTASHQAVNLASLCPYRCGGVAGS